MIARRVLSDIFAHATVVIGSVVGNARRWNVRFANSQIGRFGKVR
jgi:hypothetical protein